jgi:tetratricopeptide (TPR) repeat protein
MISGKLPCPCGSGRKYKKCCYLKPPQESTFSPNLSPKLLLGKERNVIFSIFLIALLLRLALLYQMRDSILAHVPILDAGYYYGWALKILAGDWKGGAGVYAMSPGYAYLLAVLFNIFGPNLIGIYVVQCFVSALTCVIVYGITRRFFSAASSAMASLLLAGYGASIFYANMLLKASWIEFLNASCLLTLWMALDGNSLWGWLVPGAFLGASAQFRPNLFLFLPGIIIALWSRTDLASRKRCSQIGALLLGVGLTLVPVVLRNRIVGGEWALSTAHGGMNFYTGNNPLSAVPYRPLPFARSDPQYEQDDFYSEAVRRAGKQLTRAEASEFWYHETFRTIVNDFPQWLSLMARKFIVLWGNYEQPINQNLYFYREQFSLLKPLTIIGYWLIAPLGLLGFFLSLRNRALLPLHLYFLANVAGLVSFFVVSEYRHPLALALAIYGACSLDWFKAQIALGKDSWKKIAIALGALILLSISTEVPAQERSEWYQQDLAVAYGNLGCVYMINGLWDKAVEALKKSSRIDPDYASTQYNLGESYMNLNRPVEAETHLLDGMRLRPDFMAQHFRPLLAHAYAELGELDKASVELAKTLDAYPSDANALIDLALVCKQKGKHREAAALLDRLLSVQPTNTDGLRLAIELATSMGDKPKALALLSRMAEVSPNDAAIINNLGIALAESGRYTEAKIKFKRALELNPNYTPAEDNLNRAIRDRPPLPKAHDVLTTR